MGLVEVMRDATELTLSVRRPTEMPVFIDKKEAAKPVGLEFEKPGGNTLIIKSVNEGPFDEWSSANSNRAVVSGDRIIAVGSFRGKAVDLQKKLEKATSCQAVVLRPSQPGSSW